MSMRQRALELMGDRDSIASGELRARLFPDWRQRHGDDMPGRQAAGLEMARALGVSPHQKQTAEGWRSLYLRADLEQRDHVPVVTEPARPAPAPHRVPEGPTAEPGSDDWLAARGITRCRKCGLNTPADNDLCLRCEKPM